MGKFLFTLSLIGAFTPAAAERSCWHISEMSGVAYFQDDGYRAVSDGVSSPMVLIFDGEASSATGANMPMKQISDYMAVGFSKGDGFVTVETYQVDPTLGRVIYTKALEGKSTFSGMTGARAFVGTAKRCSK